jgi:uncharacterized protein (DUF849 family)
MEMSALSKLIITCAVTGSETLPSQTPYVPLTPDQIAEEAYNAYKAGAAIVHAHARDPKTGKPTSDLNVWRTILTKIKEKCDVIVCITTGGASGMTAEERIAVVPEFKPEICSFNTESMNFGMFHIVDRIKEYKYDWEKPLLEMSKWEVYQNSFQDLEIFAKTFKQYNVKPECEIYGTNGLYGTKFLIRQGLLDQPVHVQFVLGPIGGTEATPYELVHLQTGADRAFGPNNYTWSVVGVGYPRQFELGALSISLGGHVRVGLEDNIFIRRMKLAKSNAELVEEIRKIADIFGREVATVEEARKMLNLKGIDKVNF